METEYGIGYAFILEGDTEKEFYMALLNHLCAKYSASLKPILSEKEPDLAYELQTECGMFVVKFHVVNTISQMSRAGNWFQTFCIKKYSRCCKWYVFLCYDRDDHKENISKFYEDDWATLRNVLKQAVQVIDLAASADIEDVMLEDIDSVCLYLGCAVPDSLKGRKGKVRMKNLFRDNGRHYHEGVRAKPIIEALDMEFLLQNSQLPLKELEELIFK